MANPIHQLDITAGPPVPLAALPTPESNCTHREWLHMAHVQHLVRLTVLEVVNAPAVEVQRYRREVIELQNLVRSLAPAAMPSDGAGEHLQLVL